MMISLWENCMLLTRKVEKRISVDLRHVLAVFRLWGAPPRAPEGPQLMVPNGQPSVPWEVENFFTMGWFHYGKTGIDLHERRTKAYPMIWGMFWPFPGSEGPPKGPQGSPMVPNGQPSVPWKFEIKYFTMGWFHYGKTDWHFYGTSFHFKNLVLHPWNRRVRFEPSPDHTRSF